MKQRLTRGHGIPLSTVCWAAVFQIAYILAVATFVIPEWSVERWLIP